MKTHHSFVGFLVRSLMAVLLGIGLALLLNAKTVAGDVHLDVIKTKTDVYRNVTVTGHNDTDIFIVHSRGMANVKIIDLDPDTLWRVGLGQRPVEPGSPEALAAAKANQKKMPAALAKVLESAYLSGGSDQQGAEGAATGLSGLIPPVFHPTPEQLHQLLPFLIGILAFSLVFYLFFCYCLKLIVQKAGKKAGLLIWLPIFQLIPLLRAAGMSLVWFFCWISPLLVAAAVPVVIFEGVTSDVPKAMNMLSMAAGVASLLQLLAFIVWCVRIARARGKSLWVSFFLILPVTNIFALLYLAFSSGEGEVTYGSNESKIVIPSAFSEA